MKLKDTKLGEESTCHFKIDIRNLTNFDLSTSKVQKNFCFNWILVTKNILLELQRYRRVIFHDTEELCKFRRKTD